MPENNRMKKTILSALIPLFMATSAAFGAATISSTGNVGDPATGNFPMAAEFYPITVVPEQGTLSLLGLGALGSIGLTVIRSRRSR
jgi:hypothetical protein